MLKELFEAISAKAVQASGKGARHVPSNDPRSAIYLRESGEIVTIDLEVPPPRICADSLPSFLELCDARGAVAIFVSRSEKGFRCSGILNWENEGSIEFSQLWHPIFQSLVPPDGMFKFDQRAMVRWLAQDLRGCVPPNLVSMFRQVTQTATGMAAVTAPGKERGTREFVTEAAGDLPETFLVSAPMFTWDRGCFHSDVEMGLDVTLPPQLQFYVRPLPGALDRSRDEAMDLLMAEILDAARKIDDPDEANWPSHVYLGSPPPAPVPLPAAS